MNNWRSFFDIWLTLITTFPPSHPLSIHYPQDPCEQNDLSSSSPKLVKMMMRHLETHQLLAKPPVNIPEDPRADPSLHQGVWGPWITNWVLIMVFFISDYFIPCFIIKCMAFLFLHFEVKSMFSSELIGHFISTHRFYAEENFWRHPQLGLAIL